MKYWTGIVISFMGLLLCVVYSYYNPSLEPVDKGTLDIIQRRN